jgi:type 1 glutamine amidotransferase
VSAELLFVPQVAPYTDGPAGVHGVLEQATLGVAQLGELVGLRTRAVPDVRDLPTVTLARAQARVLFTIGETPWSADQRAAILERWRAGGLAVVALHSASDACSRWDEYGAVVGGRFDGHPWTQAMAIDVVDPAHPATAHLGGRWEWYDEVYQFRGLRPDARVLLRFPAAQLDLTAPGARSPTFGFPLAWCVADGSARTFTTALGHFPAAWESPAYLRHVEGGLRWAVGIEEHG